MTEGVRRRVGEGGTFGRRRLLAAVGGTAVAGLAGCQGVREQSFEAVPVVLPAADQRSRRLAETAREPETTEQSGPGGVSVTITSHAATYSRAVGLGGE